jgi:outer membrane receptor protein involved in Fe transport
MALWRVPATPSPTQFTKPLSYAPDSLLNNEVGFKSEFFEHRLQVNASAYKMDWKNVQTLIYNPPVYGNTTFGLTGPDYRIKGGELQLAFKATDNLTLMANVSYNNSEQTTSPCIRSPGVTRSRRPIRRRRAPASRRCGRATTTSPSRMRWVRSARPRRSRPSCSTACAPATTGRSTITRRSFRLA